MVVRVTFIYFKKQNNHKTFSQTDYEEEKPKEKYFVVKDVVHAADVDANKFRSKVAEYLSSEKGRVIVNFDRLGLGQTNESLGHISPILAYNAEFDAVLLFDVARYKFLCPTYW